MLKRHKDLLRPLVANLRAILAGAAGADGTWQRGDLDRELERLGVAPDGTAIPLDALPNPTPLEYHARIAADVAAQLFGREAERGVRLLQLLDRKYAVVTNPPYMGICKIYLGSNTV